MKKPISTILNMTIIWSLCIVSAQAFELTELQGAWWEESNAPTAAFAIHGDQVWVDSISDYRPCRIEDNLLIFELGPDAVVKNRIISLDGNEMVLESLATGNERSLIRVEQ